MRAVVQRVSSASVSVQGRPVGAIGAGLLVLVGVSRSDTPADAAWLARKLHGLRVLDGERSLAEQPDAGALIVSQFTLYGETAKGRRSSWSLAASREQAEPLVTAVVSDLKNRGTHVETGEFGADMRVASVNEGPLTVLLES